MKIGDVFAGCGMFALAAHRLGLETAWVSEVADYQSAILQRRFPDVPNLGDIARITNPAPVDILAGGPPCQDISQAGKGAGLEGERSGLWFEYQRLVDEPRQSAWNREPGVPRTAEGVPSRRERLTAIGNSMMPILRKAAIYTRVSTEERPVSLSKWIQTTNTPSSSAPHWDAPTRSDVAAGAEVARSTADGNVAAEAATRWLRTPSSGSCRSRRPRAQRPARATSRSTGRATAASRSIG